MSALEVEAPALPRPKDRLRALCLDLSMTATGWVVVETPFRWRLSGILQDPRASSPYSRDNFWGQITLRDGKVPVAERIGTLCRELQQVVLHCASDGIPLDMVLAEVPNSTFEQPGRVKSMGSIMAQQRTFGAVAQWLTFMVGVPYLEVSPNDAKFCATGQRSAKKDAVRRVVTTQLTGLAPEDGGKLPRSVTEAVIDAFAVGYWASKQHEMALAGSPSGLDPLLAVYRSLRYTSGR
jgi:Holliday junction resolvasome RuvABC endonuclease subunit